MALEGKCALVTGSAAGIGRAIAARLATEGADVVLHGRVARAAGDSAARGIAADHGVAAAYVAADFRDPSAVARLIAEAANFGGGVDILVNCAAVRNRAPTESLAPAEWDAAVAVNLTAAFQTIRLALPHMRTRGWGRIVNVASLLASRGGAGRVDYAATKAGLIGLTRATALETAGSGITCNAISPGAVPTPPVRARILARAARRGVDPQAAVQDHAARSSPTGRFVDPESVAALAAFLAGPAGADVTGAVLPVDGGAQAR